MESSPNRDIVPLEPTGQIATDVLCVRCGYNLRGLRGGQGCPECGTPVALSLRGDQLRFRDPRWVARLARGALWMLAGFGGYLVAGNVGYPLVSSLGPKGMMIVMLALVAVAVAGVWQVTSPDSGRPVIRSHTDPRWLVRVLLVAAVWLVCISMLTARKGGMLMFVPGILAFVGLFGCLGMLLVHLRHIARSVPAPRLARHAGILLWVFVAGAGMKVVVDAGLLLWPNALTVQPGSTAANRWIGTMRDLSNILLIVYFVWFILLLIAYVRVLRRAAREARRNWATAPAGSAEGNADVPQREGDIHGNA